MVALELMSARLFVYLSLDMCAHSRVIPNRPPPPPPTQRH